MKILLNLVWGLILTIILCGIVLGAISLSLMEGHMSNGAMNNSSRNSAILFQINNTHTPNIQVFIINKLIFTGNGTDIATSFHEYRNAINPNITTSRKAEAKTTHKQLLTTCYNFLGCQV